MDDLINRMDDLISRQDAIRIIDNIDTWQAGWRDNAIESLKALPSAQSERTIGHWLVKQDHNGSTYGECSQCHSIQYAGHTPYCPYCGAHMKEERT